MLRSNKMSLMQRRSKHNSDLSLSIKSISTVVRERAAS